MKQLAYFMIVLMVGLFLSACDSAEWKLYDNFDSGVIAADKWKKDESSAMISVENGMAKFIHQPEYPKDSAWLIPIQKLERITGIKATVMYEGCDERATCRDVRGRMGAFPGIDETDRSVLWVSHTIEPWFKDEDSPRLYGSVEIDKLPNYDWMETLFWGMFLRTNGMSSEDVLGIPFDFTMEWNQQEITFAIKGQGQAQYSWAKTYKFTSIKNPGDAFAGIGTRSNNGCGPCTVYFDNVYFMYSK